jgi:hypothetical protein
MKQKETALLGEQSLEHDNRGLSLSDKYVALQFENQRLKKRIRQMGAAFHDEREKALQYLADRDDCQEKARESRREN